MLSFAWCPQRILLSGLPRRHTSVERGITCTQASPFLKEFFNLYSNETFDTKRSLMKIAAERERRQDSRFLRPRSPTNTGERRNVACAAAVVASGSVYVSVDALCPHTTPSSSFRMICDQSQMFSHCYQSDFSRPKK